MRVVRRVHGVVPDGALTNKRVIATELGGGEALDAEWILQLPVFKGVSGTFLELNKNAVVKREFNPGEVICREGEFGSTAFYILDGTVDVFIGSSIAHVKQEDAHESWFSKIRSRLGQPAGAHAVGGDQQAMDPNRRPRGPAVRQPDRADRDRGTLRRDDLHEFSPAVGDRTGEDEGHRAGDAAERPRHPSEEQDVPRRARPQYRQRALETHLKSVPTFASMPSDFIAYLRDRVELLRYSAGEVIVRQGDVADAFYLVRLGFVKISNTAPAVTWC